MKISGVFKLLLPLSLSAARVLSIDEFTVRRGFVKLNNLLISRKFQNRLPVNRLLVLLPSCLQDSECPHRLLFRLKCCTNCGNCDLGRIIVLKKQLGFMLAIASGGRFARKITAELKPDLIIAAACEYDLSQGLCELDTPLFGIFIRQPEGPCIDTRISLKKLKQALQVFRLKETGCL
ncbi:MAG: DUF116 domain-containing protein [Candidatus Wallbacteria bacterium]|nr:DUF116 domain-containing protein [Candidatus Wallbacteria bacterium]